MILRAVADNMEGLDLILLALTLNSSMICDQSFTFTNCVS